MLLQAAIERPASHPESACGLRAIPTVRIERDEDPVPFGLFEIEVIVGSRARRLRRLSGLDREILRFDRLAGGEHARVDQEVLELPDVSREIVCTQSLQSGAAEPLLRFGAFAGDAPEKVVREQGDIASPRAQRR